VALSAISKLENLYFYSCLSPRGPIASSRPARWQKYISEEPSPLIPHSCLSRRGIWQLHDIDRNQLIKSHSYFVSMSTSIASNFLVASPSTFLFLHERPASGYEATQPLRTSLNECGKREASRQQWESLKPLVQRLYLDDDKPFPYLAQIFRSE
jgi:hypothetical protein